MKKLDARVKKLDASTKKLGSFSFNHAAAVKKLGLFSFEHAASTKKLGSFSFNHAASVKKLGSFSFNHAASMKKLDAPRVPGPGSRAQPRLAPVVLGWRRSAPSAPAPGRVCGQWRIARPSVVAGALQSEFPCPA